MMVSSATCDIGHRWPDGTIRSSDDTTDQGLGTRPRERPHSGPLAHLCSTHLTGLVVAALVIGFQKVLRQGSARWLAFPYSPQCIRGGRLLLGGLVVSCWFSGWEWASWVAVGLGIRSGRVRTAVRSALDGKRSARTGASGYERYGTIWRW